MTASEKKLVEAYRDAAPDLKKIALKVLKGEYGEKLTTLLGAVGGGAGAAADSAGSTLGDLAGNLLSSLAGGLLGKK